MSRVRSIYNMAAKERKKGPGVEVIILDSSSSEDEEQHFRQSIDKLAEDLSQLESPKKKKKLSTLSKKEDDSEKEDDKYKDISSSDDESEIARKDTPKLMFGECPVFVRGKTEKYSFDDVMKILLDEHHQDLLCQKQPMRCQKDMTFLIDISKVKLQDLPCDDNGSYFGSGSHTWTYKAVEDPRGVEFESRKREKAEGNTKRIYLLRMYRTCKAASDFRQIVSYLEDANGNVINNKAMLQYNFKGEEHSFQALPHGNRKHSSTAFLPTNKSTKEEIKEEAMRSKPKKAILKLSKEKDLLNASSSAETPRDNKQVYNFKHSERLKGTDVQSRKDEIYAIMLQAAGEEEEGEEPFVHSIASWPEPMCILGFQSQFHDIARFCTDPSIHGLLTIDTTFNLGSFYVTPTSYRNLHLESTRAGNTPLFIGPTLVHMTHSYAAYSHLLAKLKELEPDIDDVQATMNDGEPGLMKALDTFLRNSTKLRCLGHFRKNVKDELSAFGIRGDQQKYFLDKVFGFVCGDVRVEGLLDARDEEEFDSLLLACKREMTETEYQICPHAEPSFHNWLQKHGHIMKKSMILGVRIEAGLDRNDSCTSNDAESNNHVLKSAADHEEMSAVEFISLAKSVALNQRQEVTRAILKKGDYRFKSEYSSLEMEESKWFMMSKEQRTRHLQKVLQTPVKTKQSKESGPSLSVSSLSAKLEKPQTLLHCIWAKAHQLLTTSGSISQLPSDAQSDEQSTLTPKRFTVHSESKPDSPNVVKLFADGSMECPCIMFKSSSKICSHSVAVAEKENVLAIYLDWVRTSESNCSIYNLSTKNINVRAAGQKGGKERRKKSGTKNTPTYTITNREQLAFGTAPSSQFQPNVSRLSAGSNSATSQFQPREFGRPSPMTMGSSVFQASSLATQSVSISCGPSFATVTPQPQFNHLYATPQPPVQPVNVRQSCQSSPFYQYRPPPWQNSKLFTVMNINGRIKKCVGCRREFADPMGPVFTGLVIQHLERDFYPDKDGVHRISSEQARYYHPQLSCIQAWHPDFHPRLLKLHADLLIDSLQAQHLLHHLGIQVGPSNGN